MGKRSNMPRKKNDAYDTPYSPAIPALLPHLPSACYYIEPCAGKGNLINHLAKHGHTCTLAIDIEPRAAGILRKSAFALRVKKGSPKPRFITNPPFKDEWLFPLMKHLCPMGEVWLLLPADKAINANFSEYLRVWGRDIVAIGRISWEENGVGSTENFAWFRFDGTRPPTPTIFHEKR